MPTKDICFVFGPKNAYLFRSGAQYRSHGKVYGDRPLHKFINASTKYDWVAWNEDRWFAVTRNVDKPNERIRLVMKPAGWGIALNNWLHYREFGPVRLIMAPQKVMFAWMLHGDFYVGENCSEDFRAAVNDISKVYTSIRLAAFGIAGTFAVIWEDGTMLLNLDGLYPELESVLQRVETADVSHIALSAWKVGDYFIYIDRTKSAFLKISDGFQEEVKRALAIEGVQSNQVVQQYFELG